MSFYINFDWWMQTCFSVFMCILFYYYVYYVLLLCFIIMSACFDGGGYIGQILEFALKNVYFCTAALRIV